MERIKKVRVLSERLKERELTVNVIYDDGVAFRIGKEARSGLLSLFGDVEVLDLKRTSEIFNVLF